MQHVALSREHVMVNIHTYTQNQYTGLVEFERPPRFAFHKHRCTHTHTHTHTHTRTWYREFGLNGLPALPSMNHSSRRLRHSSILSSWTVQPTIASAANKYVCMFMPFIQFAQYPTHHYSAGSVYACSMPIIHFNLLQYPTSSCLGC
jgi:hypothetical protein